MTITLPPDDPVIDIEDAFVLHRGRTHDVAALRGLTLRVDPGERIVVRGPSGAGKSTLVAELLRAGATYYSDEYAVFDKQGRVHPFPKDLEMRTNGDWKQTRHAAESFGGQTGAKPIPVGKIVVTRYRTGSKWRPRQLSQGKAVLALLANTVSARRQPEKALATLQKVVAEAQAFHGTRGEARELIPLILDES